MPTYEYKCDACDHAFEQFQSITSAPTRVCPSCKKRKVKRLISAGGGFIFKGSGFYQTDYRSESYKAAAKADQPASEKAASDKPTSEKAASDKPAEKTSTESKPAAASTGTGEKKAGKKGKSSEAA